MEHVPLADVDLVLASTSRYRAELLGRLGARFRTLAPGVDESRHPGESPRGLAERLAEAKARAAAVLCPDALVIGSDQVAALGIETLGKPGTVERAEAQLLACSGRTVEFFTAVALIDTRSSPWRVHHATDIARVVFRHLDAAEVRRYVERERPLDCAGSFKAEALGIALFERIESEDPTGLIGLPLTAVCRLLRESGVAAL